MRRQIRLHTNSRKHIMIHATIGPKEAEMNKETIHIQQAIMHIVDGNNIAIISQYLLDINIDIHEFIVGHIYKVLTSDDCKTCHFSNTDDLFFNEIQSFNASNDLIYTSTQLANRLQELLMRNPDIPSADVLYVTFIMDDTPHFAVMKMNYKPSFIHFVEVSNQMPKNTIIQQKTTLPNSTQKLDEAILVNLSEMSIKIIEKQYMIDGKRSPYLSEHYVVCSTEKSPKAQLKTLTKIADEMTTKYFHDDPNKKITFQKIISDSLQETGEINALSVVDDFSHSLPEMKVEFEAKVIESGIGEKTIQFENESLIKKAAKQTLKTDTGFVINIPIDQYGQNDTLEFINNPDGTLSILIKNIRNLS